MVDNMHLLELTPLLESQIQKDQQKKKDSRQHACVLTDGDKRKERKSK